MEANANQSVYTNQLSGSSSLLRWKRLDIEHKFGFRGGRFTSVNTLFTALIGLFLSVVFYAIVWAIPPNRFSQMFLERGITPYFIVGFSFWAAAILFIKGRKIALQRRALRANVVPEAVDFVLSPQTVNQVFERIYEVVDDPRMFILFNRITIALGNLKNLGRVSDVDDMLRSQADHDESSMETSYALLRGLIWAIPVLGFIGTVLGLSDAISEFGGVLATSGTADVNVIKDSLKGVTVGLATAFETTLEALVAAMYLQMHMTFQKKTEEEFLDSCAEYCQRNIVGRLRMLPFQSGAE